MEVRKGLLFKALGPLTPQIKAPLKKRRDSQTVGGSPIGLKDCGDPDSNYPMPSSFIASAKGEDVDALALGDPANDVGE